MSKYWSEVVRTIEPYVPGEQPQIDGLLKLNTNENPYPPSPKIAAAINAEQIDRLRLYPDPQAQTLRQTLAQHYGLKDAQVFVGNSSDEVLAQTFMAFFQQDKPVLFPDITYGFYPVYCQLFSIDAETLPLTDDFAIDVNDYVRPNGGIIFPNPNAPTGVALSLDDIEHLLKNNKDTVVVIDEAYVDFGSDSAVSLIDRYDNLLVVQTLSKSRSLAGLRVGFALGHKALIDGLQRVKNSFNSYPLDSLAQRAGAIAVADNEYFCECCAKVIATRERTAEQLTALGFSLLPSKANFIFARPPAGVLAAELAEALREKKIIVRYFNKPRISDYLRISIGTNEQMAHLVTVLSELL